MSNDTQADPGARRTPRCRPVHPWQHWRFAVTVTACWVARRHFLHLERTSEAGYLFYRCRVCRATFVDTGGSVGSFPGASA